MATIANLAVSLTAKIGNFEKGFQKAQKIASRFGKDLARHAKTIARYGAVIFSVAAAATAALVKQQLSAIDSTSKLARTVGLSTKELVGYQHAIELAGGDSEGFNKSVIRMNRTIADAQSGLSTAIREIERAGLSVQDLAGLSTDERIKLLADRYNNIGDAAGKASFLMNVFGRSGIAVGTLFEQGAEGIAAAQREAEELGLTFDSINGASVERANDAVNRLGKVVTGVARTIAIQLAPFVEIVSNRLREWAMQGNISGEVVVNAVSQITMAFGKLVDIFSLLKAGWNLFVGVVSESAAMLLEVPKALVSAWNRALEFLGIETDNTLENFLGTLVSDFALSSRSAAEEMEKAWEGFTTGAASKKAQSFFQGLQVEAAKVSDQVSNMTIGSLAADLADLPETVAKKTSEFREVNLSRIAIGGGASKKDKGDTQRQSMINILGSIEKNTKSGMAVVT